MCLKILMADIVYKDCFGLFEKKGQKNMSMIKVGR